MARMAPKWGPRRSSDGQNALDSERFNPSFLLSFRCDLRWRPLGPPGAGASGSRPNLSIASHTHHTAAVSIAGHALPYAVTDAGREL